MGNLLISTDAPQRQPYLFVLSGNAYDRGKYAASLFKQGLVDTIVCTGENTSLNLKVLGITLNEAQMTDSALVYFGVPQQNIKLIAQGTSTKEESTVIANFCNKHNLKQAQVVTDMFHTGRARTTIAKALKPFDIVLTMPGAPATLYNEQEWWKSEYGLIYVNNEYAKSLYYILN